MYTLMLTGMSSATTTSFEITVGSVMVGYNRLSGKTKKRRKGKKQWRQRLAMEQDSNLTSPTHVFKSNKNCSRRTQAGSIPSKHASPANLTQKTVFHRRHRARHKDKKKHVFKHCFAFNGSKKWSFDQLKETTLVFDGRDESNAPLEIPSGTE